ncbi:D-alanyl-D-alanine carboxypeptidase family protein [Holzapfeliella floricola]|uniref:serine-type D-Ala-D-Ala carboxypeptidase n=1 Tax=Holzapfeliella floricola DSM 23037 = JCM 16512 TaxID=1423744 RepID=A0A0R2DML5_9LACO|nr:D-alanyl-D-alanine carboxypeptidase family protein [Holzapfeliella floricola]KRN04918.1 serine-type D-Ala-D-Ala carboxypeptidase [Holzapfeliella floricola DSM 23037 = JCM 16512]
MKTKTQKITIMTIITLLLSFFTAPILGIQSDRVYAAQTSAQPKVDAKSALAVDSETGKILFNQDSTQVLPIASMTKMLTLYIVRDQIKNGKLSFDDQITVPKDIADWTKDTRLSNIPLTAGEKYSVKELYESGWIYSSNAAAMLLANKVAGSQKDFVEMMNKQLAQWNVRDAKIINVSGLSNSDIPEKYRLPGISNNVENEMSAQSLARIAQHVVVDYPDTIDITKNSSQMFASGRTDSYKMTSFNRMLPGMPDNYADLPVDGLKTGTTDAAGECFVGTAEKNGYRVITIVMHANGDENDKGKRFKVTADIMHNVFQTYTKVKVYDANQEITTPLKLNYAKAPEVALQTAAPVVVFKNSTDETPKTSIEMTVKDNELNSVNKGQQVGHILINDDGLGYLDTKSGEISIVTKNSVDEMNFFEKIWHAISSFFSSLFGK